jgi:hypothetical protein
MFKAIKIIVLLAIVVCAGVYVYLWTQRPKTTQTGKSAEVRNPDREKGVRVEEKHGFTSEGVGGP